MVLIIGLGNPGSEYVRTRHNVGWIVLDQVAKELGAPTFTVQKKFQAEVAKIGQYLLVKPLTFMNDSGQAVRAVMDFYDQSQSTPEAEYLKVVVLHDDLDLELGHSKFQFGRGPKVHNGLLSIYQHLHSHQFWHARIGVDAREGDRSMPGRAYVLQTFTPTEESKVEGVGRELIQEIKTKVGS